LRAGQILDDERTKRVMAQQFFRLNGYAKKQQAEMQIQVGLDSAGPGYKIERHG